MADDWRELSGGTFGDLTHNVLEAFGKSKLRDSTDAAQILEFLNGELTVEIEKKFHGSRLPAVRIQIEQLRLRFEQFASRQAQHRQQGWQIVSTEEHLFHEFDVDGRILFGGRAADQQDFLQVQFVRPEDEGLSHRFPLAAVQVDDGVLSVDGGYVDIGR